MPPRRPEVAGVFREHGPAFLDRRGGSLSRQQGRVFRDIVRCRTAALGGHRRHCDLCGHEEISYNSCRNRHCPKCLASQRARWLEGERAQMLDVDYFHVVFTLPQKLGPIVLQNQRQLYGALFRAAAETLSTIARDPRHLGAEIGFLMVLHTWGQNLHHHPHVHCVVPGGGISPDRSRWISCRNRFFLPVRVLSRLFRGKFLALLQGLYAGGEITLAGSLAPLLDRSTWQALTASLLRTEWVVYSKPPFGGAEQVLKYLARYTHGVAISNHRLLSISDGQVRFRWKDYAHGGKRRVMTLDAGEFIRRFLLHILPRGFVRIRHYGFLSNRSRQGKLALARRLLGQSQLEAAPVDCATLDERPCDETIERARSCPRCKQGRFIIVEEIPPIVDPVLETVALDTS